ncbi:HipA N-terminal domain-containing protein [Rhizomicrobium electricum]|uniref:HipA N-terminal domain-containing protein n=1 Tax=Rhizomicrobium electricum TaxID=480070 RepID=UPI003C7D0A77
MTDTPIFCRQTLVATITASDAGPRIRYDADWRGAAGAFPISLSMPFSAPDWGTSRRPG